MEVHTATKRPRTDRRNEDAESEAIDPSEPEAAAHAVYGWLTWFENDLVETLLG